MVDHAGSGRAFDSRFARRKATFLLHALEEALHQFACDATISVSDLPQGIIDSIQERVRARGGDPSKFSVAEHLENAYLDEVFESVISACEGSDSAVLLRLLKDKCRIYGVYDIRNACAHPAREFPIFYWYRIAAVAADPIINALRLHAVQEALISAENDQISDPSPEWLSRFLAQTPNNLPMDYQHEITGLIGRDKELGQLIDRLSSVGVSRLALTGYGGIGKTALALKALHRICSDPTIIPGLQGVVYVSLKTEQLTADGVISLTGPSAPREISRLIGEAGKEAGICSLDTEEGGNDPLSGKRIIVCIDNAETLIKEDENGFVDLLDRLPSAWKILITSRLTVDGARTLPLEPLGKSQSEFLARRYMAARNLSADSDLAKKVGFAGKGNPLCIRLIVDKICLGVDVAEAIDVAGRDLVNFSFTSLLEVLPRAAHLILETLYLTQSASRAELTDLLELDDDIVVEAMRLLQKTSLITTSFANGYESVSLNDAVSELLLSQPLLSEGRGSIRDKLRQRSQKLQTQIDKQERTGNDPWHYSYIPPDTPVALKAILIEAGEAISRRAGARERALSVASKLANVESTFASNSYYWKMRGRVLEYLGDPTAERHLRKAVSLASPPGPCIILLAQLLGRSGQAREVVKIIEDLITSGVHLDFRISEKARKTIVYNYVRSLRDLDRFQEVVDFCEGVAGRSDLLGGFAPFWISALRQDANQARGVIYDRAFCIAQECADKGLHSPVLVEEFAKLLEYLYWDWEHKRLSDQEYSDLQERLRFMVGAFSAVRSVNFDPQKYDDACKKILGDNTPPLTLEESALVDRGYVPVVVARIPATDGYKFPSFLFCKAQDGEMFFCHKSSLSDSELALWEELHVGDRLLILPSEKSADNNKFRTALSTVMFG